MTRFLITAMPFSGHVAPMSALAAALVSRGHDVRMYTGSAFRDRVEATGARFVPWAAATDFDEQDLPATFPRLVGKKGFAQLMVNMEDLFIATSPGQVADVRVEWEREPWDVLVSEETALAPGLIAESFGTPWATVAIIPLNLIGREGPPSGLGITPGRNPLTRARDALLRALVPLLSRPLTAPSARARAAVGLPPVPGTYDTQVFSTQLVLATGVPALDYGRTDRPAHVTWIGRIAPHSPASAALPDWWGDLDGRRVVHVTQGTQNVDAHDLLVPTVRGLADLDALVVVSTGVPGLHRLPIDVGANVRVADFLPYEHLLPRVDAMVTNGGWGGVLAALAHGIPLVIGGGDLDKPEVAARVAAAGAGVNLRTGTPTPSAVRAGVDRVLSDDAIRAAATRVAGDLATAGGAGRAVDLLEELASAGGVSG
jgi:UDP:flavonoid glycosyltransferase YjiC (YdhE family)